MIMAMEQVHTFWWCAGFWRDFDYFNDQGPVLTLKQPTILCNNLIVYVKYYATACKSQCGGRGIVPGSPIIVVGRVVAVIVLFYPQVY